MNNIDTTEELTFRELVELLGKPGRVYVTVLAAHDTFHVQAVKADLIHWARVGTVDVVSGERAWKGGHYDDPSGMYASTHDGAIYLHPAH